MLLTRGAGGPPHSCAMLTGRVDRLHFTVVVSVKRRATKRDEE